MDLEKMLAAAREKVAKALKLHGDSSAMVEYARKRGLKTLESFHGEMLKRHKQALERAEKLVVELEREVGQLPLEVPGKKPKG